MEKFNLYLKEFCQSTIELVDIRQEKLKSVNEQLHENLPKLEEEENKILEKILSVIKEINSENESIIINSENIDSVQHVYAFLSQFGSSNMLFKIAVDNKLEQLKNGIENQDFNKITEIKSEIEKIELKRNEIKNWYFN